MDNGENFAKAQLRSLVERIERLEEEKKAIGADIKEVFAEAKAHGFDTKIMRKVISLRKKDASERDEEAALLDLYLHAMGMTPLEEYIEQSGGDDAVEVMQTDDHETTVIVQTGETTFKAVDAGGDEMPDIPPSLDRRQSDAWGSV